MIKKKKEKYIVKTIKKKLKNTVKIIKKK